ncbi:uncharacterized protein LOC124266041 [Haliotis rubra]|uniref:uncharacterized protein LOC124266041 n=1 Tax=Haliotis rubra TaxID=36100 RepID=UPI001EE55D34|nr:uncharacterized protein LOC124266041 [Haliotis rubra]
MSVIRYICNETTRFHTFVANRVALIREATDVEQWNYIDSKSNPADMASRGIKMKRLINSSIWWNGPIKTGNQDQEDLKIGIDDPEVKCNVNSTMTETCDVIDKLFLHFSDWMNLKRSVAWILAVKEELARRVKIKKQTVTDFQEKNKKKKDEQSQKMKIKTRVAKELSTKMIDEAEESIVQYVQSQHYSAEICDLQQKRNSRQIKHYSSLRKLDPILSRGILRVGGRIDKAELSYDSKHPIILPKNSPITEVIVRDGHKRVGHLGKNTMLSELRQKFWIVGAGNVIKSVVSKCITCRKYQGQTLGQKMGDLPQRRLSTDEPPFTNTGMDFFGPILVKRGRVCVKRYGVVFTCLARKWRTASTQIHV